MLVPLKMLKFPSMTKQEKHPTSFSEFTANIQVTKENSSQQGDYKSFISSDIGKASLEELISRADEKLKPKKTIVLAHDQV